MLRRRRLPPELAAAHERFLVMLESVEAAKAAVVAAMPTARSPGSPLGEALFEFEQRLAEANDRMESWRHDAVEEEWERCRHGLHESLRLAERLRTDAPELNFDAMASAIQDLIAPLEAFGDAELRFRAVRR